MKAFLSMPAMELPEQSTAQQSQPFEVRTDESHNEDAASRKIEMFDEGETQLMRDVQLALPQHDPTCNPAPLGRTRGPKLAFANSGRPGHLHVD